MEPQAANKKSNAPAVIAAVALIIGFCIGFFAGNLRGRSEGTKTAEEKYAPIVDSAFPRPPEEMLSLSGIVEDIYGASIALEVADPDDYLPHTDGSRRAKQTRTANVLGNTFYTIVDFGKLDKQGNPTRTPITFGDIAVGDTITVSAATNIKTAQAFDVTAVEVIKY